jgi:predicted AlkP superfamily phosphohydrolase/phosphomutase
LPSAILSKGKSKLQAAVNTKMTAEVKTGKFGEMASKNPAETGAMIPVLAT